jgi:hypothetical protein
VSEPVLVWDYGFIPEASPVAERHFIDDSDHFFMLEPQKRTTGEELVRVGWVSPDEIARDLSKWTTKEQRECGRQLLKIHAGDLPAHIDEVIAQSRVFMAEITRRLSAPQPHIGHGHLSAWFESAKERMRNPPQNPPSVPAATPEARPTIRSRVPARSRPKRLTAGVLGALRAVYRTSFGSPPDVGKFHPLWLDTHYVNQRLADWARQSARILWLTSRDSLFHSVLRNRVDTAALVLDEADHSLSAGAPYDACLCELTSDELATLNRFYGKIRSLMNDDGEVIFLVSGRRGRGFAADDLGLCQTAFPAIDISEIRFFGSAASGIFRRLYVRASNSFANRPLSRVLATAAVLIGLAPFVRLANALASRRDQAIFTPHWTSLVVRFTVRKRSQGSVVSDQ